MSTNLCLCTGEFYARGSGVRDTDRRKAGLRKAKGEAGVVFTHGDVRAGALNLSSPPRSKRAG